VVNLEETARYAGLPGTPDSLGGGCRLLDPPIDAFRVWTVWLTDEVPILRSLVDPFNVWLPRKVVAARCLVEPGVHTAPYPACRCGVYGLRTWGDLEPYLHGDGPSSRPVAGRVALWGSAVAGRFGWRASFGRIVEIIPLEDDGGLAQDVASTYKVPVTSVPLP
jgi:hypothetical protein